MPKANELDKQVDALAQEMSGLARAMPTELDAEMLWRRMDQSSVEVEASNPLDEQPVSVQLFMDSWQTELDSASTQEQDERRRAKQELVRALGQCVRWTIKSGAGSPGAGFGPSIGELLAEAQRQVRQPARSRIRKSGQRVLRLFDVAVPDE